MAEPPQGLGGFYVGKQVKNLIIQIAADIFPGSQFQSQFKGGICLFIMQHKILDMGKGVTDSNSDVFRIGKFRQFFQKLCGDICSFFYRNDCNNVLL